MVFNLIGSPNKARLLSLKLKKKCEGRDIVHRLFARVRTVGHHRGVGAHFKGIRIILEAFHLFWCPLSLSQVLIGIYSALKSFESM